MKKNLIIITSLFLAVVLCVNAEKRTLVVKGTIPRPVGATEVFVDHPDSIVIVPGEFVSDIEVNVTDFKGDTLSQFVFPAQSTSVVDLESLIPQEGRVIEIKDDTGVICEIHE